MLNPFESDELEDWLALHQAIDDAETAIACTNFPEAYFPESDAGNALEVKWAKDMCRECPVRVQCAEFAIKWQPAGIWGGLTGLDRRRIHENLRRRIA